MDHSFPKAVPDNPLRRAVGVYDERVANAKYSGRLGAPVLSGAEGFGEVNLYMVARISAGPTRVPFPLPDPDGQIWATYRPSVLSADELRGLLESPTLAGAGLWPSDVPILLAALTFGTFVFGSRNRIDQANLLRGGYVILPDVSIAELWRDLRNDVATEIEKSVSPALAQAVRRIDDLAQALATLGEQLWPPCTGRLCFPTAVGHSALDLYGATLRLLTRFAYPLEAGDVANVRAGGFESLTQGAIDRSPWRPDRSLRDLVGRHLTSDDGSQPFGEFDALAVREGVGIIVSCKSILYTDQYDRGQFAAVRNVRSNIESAAARWEELLRHLRRQPVGVNYDLSQLDEIVGVVVTPQPVFLEDPPLFDETLPGLRTCCSFEELIDWLDHDDPAAHGGSGSAHRGVEPEP
jgi:hypothetical protein